MGAVFPLLLSVLLAAPATAARAAPRPVAHGARFEAARSQLKALMRNPVKRRYHHNWEKAIKALQDAAVGKDAPAATLEAARARYALYRWSANEADRDAALRLAWRAEKLGAREAARFAAAIRREAGDDRPAASPRKERPVVAAAPARGTSVRAPAPAPAPAHVAPPPVRHEPEPEPEPEPELEAVLEDLKAPPESEAGGSPEVKAAPVQPAPPPPAAASAMAGGDEEGSARPVRRIVVDAGHGGFDPGAIGPSGVREKDVTLAISRKLAERLRRAGFEVVMTRADDRYVALEERTSIANAKRGDLFVSIHANANPRRTLAGVESWVLNVADDRYATRLAARENGVGPGEEAAASDARRILTDLNARSATEASRRLAQQVQKEITGSVRERVGEVQDLGVKSALFYVLLGARMPAVLVETAFISNRREEQRLASARFQDEVAGAVSRAVVAFAAQQGPRLAHLP